MIRDYKKIIYIVFGVIVFITIAKLFIELLPWLIAIGGIAYVVTKIKGAIKQKKINDNSYNDTNYKENPSQNTYYTKADDYSNGEVIDVDYEDVDKK